MTAEHEDASNPLEDLLVEALDALESEGTEGVERVLATRPSEAARVRTHLERIHRYGLGLPDPNTTAAAHPERLGDFRIVAPLGQGGMGVVYRAVQESLGREVALKLVRSELLFFPGARERFQREVELVARMQHPGIVPVHAVGSEGGVPYLAMELVHGATLAELIEDLGGREARDLGGRDLEEALARRLGETPDPEPAALFRGSWSDVVLRILREVAEALEHAHRRGVLHRDVKPSNIMLTRAGRVLLLDFGLAGAQGGERMTRTGSQLGSLAYMAPELLAGEAQTLDARCDVYSLGATAWELFTLRLPYQSSDPVQLRELAGAAARPRLASLRPGLGWDVETVVATALEPEPRRRYASAALLARDLDNLLAHRPIEAREVGPALRLRRWSQRHPARATAAVALVFAFLIGPALFAWQERDARDRVQRERDALAQTNVELEAARALAERHLQAALAAIGHVLGSTARDDLEDVPRLQRVRLGAIERAQELVDGLERDRPGDRAIALESAALHAARAEVLYDQGRYDEALVSCRSARERVGDSAPDGPAAALWRDVWRDARRTEARVLQASLRWDEAVPIQRELELALREQLAAVPADMALQRELAQVLADLCKSLGRVHGPDPARAELSEGLALARRSAAESSEDPAAAWLVGRLAEELAEEALWVGDLDGAAAAARESLEAYRASAAFDSGGRFREANLATALGMLGRIEQTRGQDAEALYGEAIAILRRLADDFPEAVRYRLEQARLLDEQAFARRRSARAGVADTHRESLAIFEQLLVEQPDRCQLRFAAAVAFCNWANYLIHVEHDYPGALSSCERAEQLLGPCAQQVRTDALLEDLTWRSTYLRALALCLGDDAQVARPEIERCVAAAGEANLRWRFAADLWCEWTLAQERAAAPQGLVFEGRDAMFEALHRAVDLGYRNVEELRNTPALQRFRDDPELVELLAGIE